MKAFCMNFSCFRRRRCDCSSDEEEDSSSQSAISLVDVQPKVGTKAPPIPTYPEKAADKAPKPPKGKPLKVLKPLKPGKVQKSSSPKKNIKFTTPKKVPDSSSDEQFTPRPSPLFHSQTGITPEMSDVDIGSSEKSDTDLQETEHRYSAFSSEDLLDQSLEDILAYSAGLVNPMHPIPRKKTNTKTLNPESESESSSDDVHLYLDSSRHPHASDPSADSQPSNSRKRANVEESESPAKRVRLLEKGHTGNLTDEEMMELGKSWPSPPWGLLPWGTRRRGPVLPRGQSPEGDWGSWPCLRSSSPGVPFGPKLSSPRLLPSPMSISSNDGSFLTLDGLYSMPDEATVAAYRRKGAQLIAWLEHPNEPNCNIAPATASLQDLFNATPPDHFELGNTHFTDPGDVMVGGEPETVGLIPFGSHYRRVAISNKVTDPVVLAEIGRDHASNGYSQLIGPGLLIAYAIFRYDNIQWNVAARAVYMIDHDMETLKYIMFHHVVNEETQPYILRILYPERGLEFDQMDGGPCVKVERGTREFEELIGTKLGKAAAILLISSLPRGTRRIARAVIWNSAYKVQVRFEIESTNPDEEIPRAELRPGFEFGREIPAELAAFEEEIDDNGSSRALRSSESDEYVGSECWDE
ncbi:hypothetical protein N7447_003513 [Penicillium robsamsonii]|uniref:uncharacterized protein n=1 Tax=Penicillium robsamsonii TaxID=1792511 RepID=UPI002546B182|nr:uncharacterized protein N7447_003513 [Penicillium robsamsonii]KAJ5826750.1 hypothetical protein N7447_003513 [Penicillium robsamsonii]